MADQTEKTLSVVKMVIVGLLSALLAGGSSIIYLNTHYVSKEEYAKLQDKISLMDEKYKSENLDLRLRYVESNQQWIATTLMAIAYKVGVQVEPPPTVTGTPR